MGDGKIHTIDIDLARHPEYRGAMTQLRIELPAGEGSATIHTVELKKSQSGPRD